MKKYTLTLLIWISVCLLAKSQNYTSTNDGSFTTAANWNNTSGFGTSTPPIDGSHGSGTITMQNNMSVSSSYTLGSAILNISSSKTLTVNGSFTANGGSSVTVNGNMTTTSNVTLNSSFTIPSGGTLNVGGNLTLNGGSTLDVTGTLNITGNVTLDGTLNVKPGGVVIVNGSVTVNNSEYLIIGTSVAATPYASMVIKQNLVSNGSGDVHIKQNGRLAVFGNFTSSSSGGTFILLDSEADLYINGTSTLAGGGDHITNNNASSPWGFYTDNTPTYSGGGAGTDGTAGSNAVQPSSSMQSQNPDFYNFITSISGNPLPVTLLFFNAANGGNGTVKLSWATSTEINFDYFEIKRSTDGKKFEQVTRMSGQGNTELRTDYFFEDEVSWKGMVYYSLRAVDFDGSSEEFPWASTNLSDQRRVVFYPDGSGKGTVHALFNYILSTETSVHVFDLNGRLVSQLVLSPERSEYALENLPDGLLIMKVSSPEIQQVTRLLK